MKYIYTFFLTFLLLGQEIQFTTSVINNLNLTEAQNNPDNLFTIDIDNSTITVTGENVISGFTDIEINNSTLSVDGSNNIILGTGAANRITITGSTLMGQIDTGGGDDELTLSTGTLAGGIITGMGNDKLTLDSFIITGNVDLGIGNDRLILVGLSDIILESGDVVVDGGEGNDVILLGGTGNQILTTNLINFETLEKDSTSNWALAGNISGIINYNIRLGSLIAEQNAILNLDNAVFQIDNNTAFIYNENDEKDVSDLNSTTNITFNVDGLLNLNNNLISEGGQLNLTGALTLVNDVSLGVATLSVIGGTINFEFDTARRTAVTTTSTASLSGIIALNITNANENNLTDGDSFTIIDFASDPVESNVEFVVNAPNLNNPNGVFIVSRDAGNGNDVILTYTIRRLNLSGASTIETTAQVANNVEDPEFLISNSASVSLLGQNLDAIVGFETVSISDSTIRVDATNNAILTTAGDDTITISSGGQITGNIITAGGEDTITISGNLSIIGNIDTGADNDTVTINGSVTTIFGSLITGAGEDTITITGSSAVPTFELATTGVIIDTGADNDTISFNNLRINETTDLGTGDDSITLLGTGTIELGASIINVENIIVDSTATWTLSNTAQIGSEGVNADFDLLNGVFIHSDTAIVNLGSTGTGGNLNISVGATYQYQYDAGNSGILFGSAGGLNVDGTFSLEFSENSSLITNTLNLQGTLIGADTNQDRVHIITNSVTISNGTSFDNISFDSAGNFIQITANGSANVNGLITINLVDTIETSNSFTNGQTYTLIDGSASGVTLNDLGFQYQVNHPLISSLNGTFIVEINGNDLVLVFRTNIIRLGAGITTTSMQVATSSETIFIADNNSIINVDNAEIAISGFETVQLNSSSRVETDGAIAIQTTAGNDSIIATNFVLVGGIDTLAGNDSIILSNGVVNLPSGITSVSINLGAGDDSFNVTNSTVNADISTGADNDDVIFSGSYSFFNDIDLGDDDDTLTFEGFATFNTQNNSQTIDGGAGTDSLILRGTGTNSFFGNISNFESVTKSQNGVWIFQAGSQLTAVTLQVEAGTLRFADGEINNDNPPVTTTNGASLMVTGDVNVAFNSNLIFDRNSTAGIDATASSSFSIDGNIIVAGTFSSSVPIITNANNMSNIDVTGRFNLQIGSSITNVNQFTVSGTVNLVDEVTINSIADLTVEGNFNLREDVLINSITNLDLDGTLAIGENSSISSITSLDLDGTITFDSGANLTATRLDLSNENVISIEFNVDDIAIPPTIITATDVNIVAPEDIITVIIANTSTVDLESGEVITLISSVNANALTVENFTLSIPNLAGLIADFRIEKQGNNIVIIYTENTITLNNQTLTETQIAIANAVIPSVSLSNTSITISNDTNALENFENVTLSNSTLTITGTGNAIFTTDNDDTITVSNSDISGAVVTGAGDDTVTLNNGIRSEGENLTFDFGDNTVIDDMDDETYEGDTLVLAGTTEQDFNYTVSNLERLNITTSGQWTLLESLTATDQVNIESGTFTVGEAGFLSTANLNINAGTFDFNNTAGTLDATSITIAENANFIFNAGTFTADTVNVTGALDIKNNIISLTNLNLINRATLAFELDSADIGRSTALITTTKVIAPANFDLFLRPEIDDSLRDFAVGDIFTILSGNSALNLDLNQTNFTSGQFTFDIDTETNPNQLRLVITDINTFDESNIRPEFTDLTASLVRLDNSLVDPTSEEAQLLDELNQLTSQQRSDATTYVAPTIHTSSATRLFDIVKINQQFIVNRLNNKSSTVSSFLNGPDIETKDSDIVWWVDYSFLNGKRDSVGSAFGYNYDGNTLRIGLEREFNSELTFGFSFAYADTITNNNDRSGSSDSEAFSLNLYSSNSHDNIFYNIIVDYSFGESENTRNIIGAGNILGSLTSDVDTRSISLSYDISVRKRLESNRYFYPTFGIFYSVFGFDSFQETGSLGFSVKKETYSALSTKLGFRLESQKNGDIGNSATFFQAFWNYNFGELNRDITATFNNVNVNDNIRIRGAKEDASIFALSAGWYMKRHDYQYGVSYNYSFSSTTSSNTVSLQYKRNF